MLYRWFHIRVVFTLNNKLTSILSFFRGEAKFSIRSELFDDKNFCYIETMESSNVKPPILSQIRNRLFRSSDNIIFSQQKKSTSWSNFDSRSRFEFSDVEAIQTSI